MNNSNGTNVDTVDIAVQKLSQALEQDGKAYEKPMLELYTTSIFLVALIHLLFAFHWKNRMTKKDVSSSYRSIVVKKQFHKALISTLSHPQSDRAASYSYTPINDGHSSMVPMGNESESSADRRPFNWNRTHFNRAAIIEKLRSALHPIFNSFGGGLPLLAYVSHIIWQCRPLEEFFDYASDRQSNSMHHPLFNVTTILTSDKIIHKSLLADESSQTSSSRSEEVFRYHRVIIALMLTTLILDLLVTHIGVMYLRRLAQRTSVGQQTMNGLMDKGTCSLAPFCASLLIVYTTYFPHTSVSPLPFFNMTRIGLTSSGTGFLLSYIMLNLLSFQVNPPVGMLYGSISGLLFTNGLTTFLAGSYSGNCAIFFLILFSTISYKANYLSLPRTRRIIPRTDWLPCIENVLWDENGEIKHNE